MRSLIFTRCLALFQTAWSGCSGNDKRPHSREPSGHGALNQSTRKRSGTADVAVFGLSSVLSQQQPSESRRQAGKVRPVATGQLVTVGWMAGNLVASHHPTRYGRLVDEEAFTCWGIKASNRQVNRSAGVPADHPKAITILA
ncbi:predicted protein [Uncinocarpus reesii 1704]|uniref:Uncharacterized protein n=1 Tax=Uncinocarpus reesii (strain UAMH 1704) TaxID=336963 RepID=C4JQA8_UNCRE|nr:uncharacterized protein UREG_04662 [Uncinocarpus reesii 1704]EEP79816.1 predicted protein [Uncinocarpus reesii 1704]